jgi:hypothetical protein
MLYRSFVVVVPKNGSKVDVDYIFELVKSGWEGFKRVVYIRSSLLQGDF